MAPLKIACLDWLWWGVCIGGRHYTGHIHFENQRIELERRLTLREAKEMSETQERLWRYCHERTTNKFDDWDQMARHARKWCRANLGEHWLLLERNKHNPNKVIAAHGPIKERARYINDLAILWDKVPNSQREGVLWDQAYKLWRKLLTI